MGGCMQDTPRVYAHARMYLLYWACVHATSTTQDGEELDRGSLVSATCALHRLVHRRGGLWPSLEDPSGGFASEESYLVVSYDEVGPQMLADVLAAYLHWFGGMTLTDAIKVRD